MVFVFRNSQTKLEHLNYRKKDRGNNIIHTCTKLGPQANAVLIVCYEMQSKRRVIDDREEREGREGGRERE